MTVYLCDRDEVALSDFAGQREKPPSVFARSAIRACYIKYVGGRLCPVERGATDETTSCIPSEDAEVDYIHVPSSSRRGRILNLGERNSSPMRCRDDSVWSEKM